MSAVNCAGAISTANRCGLVEACAFSHPHRAVSGISTANRCGLVEATKPSSRPRALLTISTANRCGLVEAKARSYTFGTARRSPQLIAVASLKLSISIWNEQSHSGSPQLIAVASLKRERPKLPHDLTGKISTANRCGLVEAHSRNSGRLRQHADLHS
mgnify:CR=1 FL=1